MANLPLRFKAGGIGGPPAEPHHHRSTTKSPHKAFKSKHASKSSLRAISKVTGKIGEITGPRRSSHQQAMSKLDRRNQARQKLLTKRQEQRKARSLFVGHEGTSKRVVMVPLGPAADTLAAVATLKASVDLDEDVPMADDGVLDVYVPRFKQNVRFVVPPSGMMGVLDACRTADFVIFVGSADDPHDRKMDTLLAAVASQGVSNVVVMLQVPSFFSTSIIPGPADLVKGFERAPGNPLSKGKALRKQMLQMLLPRFFPGLERLYDLGTRSECTNVMRSICTTNPRGIHWRDARSWMAVEGAHASAIDGPHSSDEMSPQHVELVLSGTVRGNGLKADRLVQLGDYGTYQISKITTSISVLDGKRNEDSMIVDQSVTDTVLDHPSNDQDDLAEMAPVECPMTDVMDQTMSQTTVSRKGVLLDDHHYFSDDDAPVIPSTKRLPAGTSSYQAAWYLDDDSGSSVVSEELQDEPFPGKPHSSEWVDQSAQSERGIARFSEGMKARSTVAPSTVAPSEMFLDPSPEQELEQISAFRAQRKSKAEQSDDLEFPDEIELGPQMIARERLARYRGLKSLRTSPWETDEDQVHEPEDWNRLLRFYNSKGTQNRVMREATIGGVPAGTRVQVHLRNVPLSLAKHDLTQRPLCLYSLLRHEHKRTVMHVSITLPSNFPHSIKSKEELILQCGPRRFIIRPLFSELDRTPNNVHKYKRFLHPGSTAVASFIGPVTWGAVPVLFFTRQQHVFTDDSGMEGLSQGVPTPIQDGTSSTAGTPELVGHGTTLPPDPNRVIAKRIILTGHPYKIHRNVVTVRYMFFNADDVNWFKALPLWTKWGRTGYIKESLGTHGYFKATFDGKINPQDAVCVSLYKRVFPRLAEPWRDETF
ncbi:MAG: hypothetical protein M1823_003449 [Watsoniomyces obsoletus]|nr:MAG: hypothetical protein M1823_003449 [Watsoniomyces obsoletus]